MLAEVVAAVVGCSYSCPASVPPALMPLTETVLAGCRRSLSGEGGGRWSVKN